VTELGRNVSCEESTVHFSSIVENDFVFPKVKWLQMTGEVGRFISL